MTLTEHGRTVGPHAGLLDWLAGHGVEYELHEHPLTFTARETAAIEGVDPRRFAKTLVVEAVDGRRAIVVLDAVDHADLRKVAEALGSTRARLLTETELLALAPDCEVGTIPPIGEPYGLPVYADRAVHDDPDITFHAASHHFTAHVDRPAWERAVGVVYADRARDRDPAWDR